MKNTTTSFCILPASFVLLCMVWACNPPANKKLNEKELLAEANKLDSLFLAAFNKGDAEAIMQLHWNSPELRSYAPGDMVLNGYEAVKASYVRDFAASKGAKLEYSNANNVVFADGVLGHGTFTWTMPMEGAEPMVMHGRYTEMKAIKDGKLVIIVDHASAPMPPPPAEEPAAEPTQ